MSNIEIHKNSITHLSVDAVVNAANEGLHYGGGVCGAIFEAAGVDALTAACKKLGHCDTGSAVITPAFGLKKNKYIIHAVGPRYLDGKHGEETALYGCYTKALQLAKAHGCKSIGFPLISSGIFGYPLEDAWRIALKACSDFIAAEPGYDINIVFVGNDRAKLDVGLGILNNMPAQTLPAPVPQPEPEFVFFWKIGEENGYLSNWYPAEFVIEGIKYWCVEQYMMAKKALLFGDLATYQQIMQPDSQAEVKALGKAVKPFDSATWAAAKEEVVFNACYAKFSQNGALKKQLISTFGCTLAEASPKDKIWGIGLAADAPEAKDPKQWQGRNLLGKVLERVRGSLLTDNKEV